MDLEAAQLHRPSSPAHCGPERCDGVVPGAVFSSGTLSSERLRSGQEQECFSPEARVPFRRVTACPDAPMKLATKRPRARLGSIARKLFAEPEAISA